jgi:hypothetical protein
MKRARAYLEQGQVVSSYWAPPLLRGVVQAREDFLPRFAGDQNELTSRTSATVARRASGEKSARTASPSGCIG